MRHQQTGATLIIVLILLLAITIIGVSAIRQSTTSLNIATNSQVQQLLFQNSDVTYFNVEKQENLLKALTASGMFGYMNREELKDAELIFCIKGETEAEFFNMNRASLIQWEPAKTAPTNNKLGVAGYCKSGTGGFFTSGRQAVITQVAVKFPSKPVEVAPPFSTSVRGTDGTASKVQTSGETVRIFSVSVMPTLSSASTSDIDKCLSEYMNEPSIPAGISPSGDKGTSVTDCLNKQNAVFTSHVADYVISQDFQ